MSYAAQGLPRLIEKLGRERTGTDAGAICLENAIYVADAGRSHAQTGAGARAKRIGRSDERIGAEIHVQKRALGALGEYGSTVLKILVHKHLIVDESEAAERLDGLEPLLLVIAYIEIRISQIRDGSQMAGLQRVVAGTEIRSGDVADTQADTRDLVSVGRAYALEGGANLRLALGGLVRSVEYPVGREYEIGALGNLQAGSAIKSHFLDLGNLVHQNHRVYDHAIADDVRRPVAENAGRHRMEDKTLAGEMNGMAGIRSALETGNHVIVRSQHIDDLAFALVAPLHSQNHVNFLHSIVFQSIIPTFLNICPTLLK